MHSAKAPFNSHASNVSTVKKSYLPANITAKNHAKQFSAIEILPIQVAIHKKGKAQKKAESKSTILQNQVLYA